MRRLVLGSRSSVMRAGEPKHGAFEVFRESALPAVRSLIRFVQSVPLLVALLTRHLMELEPSPL
jgi:hypothetical protein